MKTLRTSGGFSLIELMIVVAIIGILATIAVPNFTKFKNKAKQSEAKGHLSAIYTGEKTFYNEFDGYIGSVNAIGFAVDGSNTSYSAGFTGCHNNPDSAGKWNYASCTASLPGAITSPTGYSTQASSGASGTFLAAAKGTLQTNDEWTINETRVMSNRVSGL